MKKEYKISHTGAERLATEIFRQAVCDWDKKGQREDVNHFFVSEWGYKLADYFGYNPLDAQKRLSSKSINPKDFRAEYRSKRAISCFSSQE